jgi:hypothetical protein
MAHDPEGAVANSIIVKPQPEMEGIHFMEVRSRD